MQTSTQNEFHKDFLGEKILVSLMDSEEKEPRDEYGQ